VHNYLLYDANVFLVVTEMPVNSYLTIQKLSEGSYKEKGSKFLAFAFPLKNEEDVKIRVEELKKKYFDARHHCFAWVLGADKTRFRAFDDGEPNHSAGDPILGQIRSKDLTNVLVIVVRYFGGVKLGVGGLINAYRTAALEALQNATIVQEDVIERFHLKYSFDATPQVMKLIKEFDLQILEQNFDTCGNMEIEVKLKMKNDFLDKVKLLKNLHVEIELVSQG